jgi:hypothetical protein
LDLRLLFFSQIYSFVPFILLFLDSHFDVLVIDVAELVFGIAFLLVYKVVGK